MWARRVETIGLVAWMGQKIVDGPVFQHSVLHGSERFWGFFFLRRAPPTPYLIFDFSSSFLSILILSYSILYRVRSSSSPKA